MMNVPVIPFATFNAVEPCLCAWYQCVPGAWPIRILAGSYFGSGKQYGFAPSWYCGHSFCAIWCSSAGQSCMPTGSCPGCPRYGAVVSYLWSSACCRLCHAGGMSVQSLGGPLCSHFVKNGASSACACDSDGCRRGFVPSDGRTNSSTLSPVVLGVVCVPWKCTFVVLDPCRQSGILSLPALPCDDPPEVYWSQASIVPAAPLSSAEAKWLMSIWLKNVISTRSPTLARNVGPGIGSLVAGHGRGFAGSVPSKKRMYWVAQRWLADESHSVRMPSTTRRVARSFPWWLLISGALRRARCCAGHGTIFWACACAGDRANTRTSAAQRPAPRPSPIVCRSRTPADAIIASLFSGRRGSVPCACGSRQLTTIEPPGSPLVSESLYVSVPTALGMKVVDGECGAIWLAMKYLVLPGAPGQCGWSVSFVQMISSPTATSFKTLGTYVNPGAPECLTMVIDQVKR